MQILSTFSQPSQACLAVALSWTFLYGMKNLFIFSPVHHSLQYPGRGNGCMLSFFSFFFLWPRQSLTGIWGNKSCHITNWLYVCKMSSFLPVECLLSVEELQALHNDRMTESNQNRSPSFLAADRRLQTQQHVHLSIWCLVRRLLWTPHSPLNTTAGMEEPHQRVSLAWREKWTVRFEASFVCN